MKNEFDKAVANLRQDPTFSAAYDRQALIIGIAQMIRQWRKDVDLTQVQLAERLNMHQTAISRLESSENDSIPSIKTLRDIAHACEKQLLLSAVSIENSADIVNKTNLEVQQDKVLAI